MVAPGFRNRERLGLCKKTWRKLYDNEFCFVSLVLLVLESIFFYREVYLAQPRVSVGLLYGLPPWNASLQGTPEVSSTSDTIFQFQAWRQFAAKSFSHGVIPLWNPYNFAGAPFLGNLQSALFSPFSLPYYFLPYGLAETLTIVAKLYVAGVGMYFLVRCFRLSRYGAFVSSITFTFCGSLIVWLDYPLTNSAVLLPALFWGTHRFHEQQSAKRFATLASVICIQILGGHLEATAFCVVAAALFLVCLLLVDVLKYRTTQILRHCTTILCLAVVCFLAGLALSGIQLFPFLDYMLHSYVWTFKSSHGGGLSWPNVISLLLPNFWGTQNGPYWGIVINTNFPETNGGYIGPIALVLVAIALVSSLRKKIPAFFFLLAVTSMLVIYDFPYVSVYAIFHSQLLTMTANGRVLLIFAFSAAVLAGFGADHVESLRKKELLVVSGIAGAMMLAALFAVLMLLAAVSVIPWSPVVSTASHTAVIGFLLFSGATVLAITVCGFLSNVKRRPVIRACMKLFLILLIVTSLFSTTIDYNITNTVAAYPPAPALEYLQRDTGIYRVLSAGFVLPPETNIPYNIFDIRGYDAIDPTPFTYLEAQVGKVEMITNIQIYRSYDSPALNLMNVKYVMLKTGMQAPGVSPPRFSLVYSDSAVSIYLNSEYLPRAFLIYNYTSATNEPAALTEVSNGLINYDQTVILGPLPTDEPLPTVAPGHGNATSPSYSVNSVEVSVKTTSNCLLFISDAYFPGWEAFVDGAKSFLYRADYSFRAVQVPKGTHKIEFVYNPLSVTYGAYTSLSTALLVLFALGWAEMLRRKRRNVRADARKADRDLACRT
jgi:hypothetical protein